jgi:nitrite reductase/ring-hydroxylating ferredoxin subunit
MGRDLDCQEDTIFDDDGEYLRCSMHGVTYDPMTGESLTAMCRGEKLTALKVEEDEEGVWLCDKRVKRLEQ